MELLNFRSSDPSGTSGWHEPLNVAVGFESFRTIGSVNSVWHSHSKHPSDWRDNRKDKVHPKSPDFKHMPDYQGTPQRVAEAPETRPSVMERAGNLDHCSSRLNSPSGDSKSPQRNESSWTALISQYAKSGQGRQALKMYEEMRNEGVRPSQRTFVAVLKACSSMQDLESAKRIHSDVVKSGFQSDLYVGTMLVDAYAKCRSLADARHAFERMPRRDAVSWNAMILGYTQMNKGEDALQLYSRMQQEGVTPHDRTYVSALKACSTIAESGGMSEREWISVKERCLKTVRAIHADIVKGSLESGVFVGNILVDAYAKCGSLVDARRVFEKIPCRDVVSWNAMILGYAQMDKGEEALHLYTRMQLEGVVPDSRTYVAALKACSTMAEWVERNEGDGRAAKETCLETVRSIHADVVKAKIKPDVFVDTMLVDVYSKSGSLKDARDVFEKMPDRTVVSWNAMISGCALMDRGEEALLLYTRMQREGLVPNDRTYVSVLKACSTLAASDDKNDDAGTVPGQKYLETVRAIHSDVKKGKYDLDVFVGNVLVDAYAQCGSLVDARYVFEKIPHRNVASWTAMISGCAQLDKWQEVLRLYAQMQQEGVVPNDRTYIIALKACIAMAELGERGASNTKCEKEKCLETVRAIHTDIVKQKLESSMFLGTMLVDAYAKCRSLEDAKRVFETMPRRDVFSWNIMILGYAQMEKGEEALQLYSQMQRDGVVPNGRTCVSALKACSTLAEIGGETEDNGRAVKERCLDTVRDIYAIAVKEKVESDLFVRTMLVDVYAKCGSLEDARSEFEKMAHRDVVSWTAMIFGYAQMGKGEEALELYTRMQQEGVVPNERTYVSALKACSSLAEEGKGNEWGATGTREKCLEVVRSIHTDVVKRGLESGVFVGTMLVDVYAKCGSLEDARRVFETMPHRDVVSWTAMILGYAQMDKGDEALQLYTQMQREGVMPNKRTYVGALNACGGVAGLEKGKEIHAQIMKAALVATDSFVINSLINMYSRCGSMVDAQQVFDAVPRGEVVTWNALISGYAHQGESELVFDLFHRMKQEGIPPNDITFLAVLTACSQVGLLDRGQTYFTAMSRDYAITPTIKHVTCMVDLFSRSGQLDKAMDIMRAMPFEPDYALWECILGACQKWGAVELGRQAFQCAVRLNKDNPAAYVLMSNIYGAAHMWAEAKEIQATRMDLRVWKQPGQSQWTDMDGVAHMFGVGDQGHPESQHMYAEVRELLVKVKQGGYEPNLGGDILAEDEEDALCGHSEKLVTTCTLLQTRIHGS